MKAFLSSLLVLFFLVVATQSSPVAAQKHDIQTLWHYDSLSTTNSDTIELSVYDLKSDGQNYQVQLEQKHEKSAYILPVWIGGCEMSALNAKINSITSSRPMTYDLVTNIFSAANIKMTKMVITKIVDGTYYAIVEINNNGKISQVDSRPSVRSILRSATTHRFIH